MSIRLSVCLFLLTRNNCLRSNNTFMSVCLSVCLYVCLSVLILLTRNNCLRYNKTSLSFTSVCLSVCLYVCLSDFMSVSLSLFYLPGTTVSGPTRRSCLSVFILLTLNNCLRSNKTYVCLSLRLSLCLYVCLSVFILLTLNNCLRSNKTSFVLE